MLDNNIVYMKWDICSTTFIFLWFISVICKNIYDDAVLSETCVFKEDKNQIREVVQLSNMAPLHK